MNATVLIQYLLCKLFKTTPKKNKCLDQKLPNTLYFFWALCNFLPSRLCLTLCVGTFSYLLIFDAWNFAHNKRVIHRCKNCFWKEPTICTFWFRGYPRGYLALINEFCAHLQCPPQSKKNDILLFQAHIHNVCVLYSRIFSKKLPMLLWIAKIKNKKLSTPGLPRRSPTLVLAGPYAA